MSFEDIKIEIIQGVTPEVIEGLKLYAKLTSRDFNINSWLYWFKDNPYGSGLHVLAIHRGKVVGFYSLIPTEMYLAGRTLIGAKGEFLVVEPSYRNKCVGKSGIPLAFDLVKIINHEAVHYGIEATLAVASGPAAMCHRFSGARAFEFPCRHFFTFFTPSEYMKNPVKKALIQSGLFSIPRAWLELKSIVNNKKDTFTYVQNLNTDDFYKSKGTNRLLHPSSKMINFRFPDEEYIKYLTYNENNVNYLVFTKPRYKGQVRLKDWSSLNLQKFEFENIFRELFRQCRMQRAESMHLLVPDDGQKTPYSFYTLGFLSRRFTSIVYIYSSNNIIRELDSHSWEFTDAHTGYV